jgi:sec-independent protein translocase protein TatB
MFDISWSEMLLVAIIAIVVIGPKDLPAALRQAGKWMAAVRRMATEFQGHVNEAMKEAELDELRKELTDLKRTARGIGNPMHTIRDEMRGAIEGKPAAAAAAPPAVTTAAQGNDAGVMPDRAAAELPAPRPADMPLPASPTQEAHFQPQAETKLPEAIPVAGEGPRVPQASEIKS